MKFFTALSLIALTVPLTGQTNTDLAEQLYAINKDYAKCLDVALGNFNSETQTQKAMSKFYEAITSNTDELIELQIRANDKGMLVFLDMLQDRRVLLGYMVAKMSEPDKAFEANKRQLKKKYDFDWKLVHQELWRTNGCNAIYDSFD